METVEYRYLVEASIELTGKELEIITKAALQHYDGTCRSAASGSIDGQIVGDPFVALWARFWIQARVIDGVEEDLCDHDELFESELFKKHSDKTVLIRSINSRQADLTCKILEFRGYDMSNAEHELQSSFRKLFGSLVREWEEVNKRKT